MNEAHRTRVGCASKVSPAARPRSPIGSTAGLMRSVGFVQCAVGRGNAWSLSAELIYWSSTCQEFNVTPVASIKAFP